MSLKHADKERLNAIIKRLFTIPYEKKHLLPSIFTEPMISTFTILTDSFFILFFNDADEEKRVRKLVEEKKNPYPGLIKPEEVSASVAFRLNKSKNNIFQDNKVNNMYSLSLGKDCSLILIEHKQSLKTEQNDRIDYIIKLSYIISFGDEINNFNFYEYLDELVNYSLKNWGIING